LKRPDARRRTFQIVPYERVNGKLQYGKPLEHEALKSLNKSYLAGELTANDALLQIKQILIPKLKNQFHIPMRVELASKVSEGNLRAFMQYWNTEYRRKKLENPKNAKNEFLRALYTLEPLSLHSTDIDTIQDHWDARLKGTRHKRYGGRINQLLRYLKREVQISLDRADRAVTSWVSWEELQAINDCVSNPVLRDLYCMLWGTGLRLGEAFVLSTSDLKGNGTLFINSQMAPDLRIKKYTKNRIEHDAIILPVALEASLRWLAIPNKDSYRKRCQHPLINASKGKISPHTLRHSFVRALTDQGMPLDKVALLIGDTLKTTEDTYRGWRTSSNDLDFILKVLAKKA
jgi:integrase